MPYEVQRDYVGYGANPPDPKWPGGARLALNFVMNYEEGSEYDVRDDGHTDFGLSNPRARRCLTATGIWRPNPCSNMAAASASGG